MKRIFLSFFISFITFSFHGQSPTFQWAKTFPVNSPGYSANKIVTDDAGNIYTAGGFKGTIDLDPGPATFTIVSGNGTNYDVFVSKFDASGNFIWGKSFGSYGYDEVILGMTIDTANNIHLTGSFYDIVDFDPGASTFTLGTTNSYLSYDTYILKLDQAGNFVWAKQLGGNGGDQGLGITVDSLCNVYATGFFTGTTDLDPGPGTYSFSSSSGLYISKLNSSGNFVFGKIIPCSGSESADGIEIDNNYNIYISGRFFSTVDFDPGSGVFNLTSNGAGDIFILKLDPLGNFLWAKSSGGLGMDWNRDIAVDPAGNVLITGSFRDIVDFDPSSSTYTFVSTTSSDDGFIWKLDPSGNFLWARQFGNSNSESMGMIDTDVYGNIYYTNSFKGTVDFDPGSGIFNLTSAPSTGNIAIGKLDGSGNFMWAKALTGGSGGGYAIWIDLYNNIYTTGIFSNTVDFDPETSVFNLTGTSSSNVYLHKLGQSLSGIDEIINVEFSNIFPNPNNGSFTIELNSNSQVQIHNVMGEEIFNQTLSFGKQKINLEKESSGVYFVQIKESNNPPVTKRMVVTR